MTGKSFVRPLMKTGGELLQAQEMDLLNGTVERTRRRIDEIIHQTGVTISDEVYEVVVRADKASAANDWDESIRLLLDVFDSVGAKGAPRFFEETTSRCFGQPGWRLL